MKIVVVNIIGANPKNYCIIAVNLSMLLFAIEVSVSMTVPGFTNHYIKTLFSLFLSLAAHPITRIELFLSLSFTFT